MNKKIIKIIIIFILIIIAYFLLFQNGKKIVDSEISNNLSKEISKNNFEIKNQTITRSEEMENIMKINIRVNEKTLIATLNDNSSSKALVEKLKEGELTIEMQDYSNFEKVGNLGFNLPRNDEQISTDYGDLILYQGNQFVIYYDKNSWNFTKLGKIDNITQDELKEILGSGNVTVTIFL